MKIERAVHILVVSGAIVLYLFLAGREILLPGLEYDEALQVPAAILMMHPDIGPDISTVPHVKVAGRTFPVMQLEYLGSLKSYVLALSFSLLGISVPVLRWTTITISAVGILFFAKFSSDAFGRSASALTAVLLATDPSLIIYSRTDWGPIAIGLALKGAALCCLSLWWKSGGSRLYLAAAAFLFGLGIYDKVNFVWFVAATVVAGAVLWFLSDRRPAVSLKDIPFALIPEFIGSAPLWAFNVVSPLATFRLAMDVNQRSSQTILQRIGILKDVLRGNATEVWMFGKKCAGFLLWSGKLWPLFLASIIFLIVFAIMQKKQRCRSVPLLAAIAVVCFLILVTPLLIGPHHWIMIYPLPQLAIAWMLTELWKSFRMRTKSSRLAFCASALVLCLTLFAVAGNIAKTTQYILTARNNGGAGSWTDSIYELSDALRREYPHRPIQLMDWGFFTQLHLLSAGSLHIHEPFWNHRSDSKPWPELIRLVSNPDNVFVVHQPKAAKFVPVQLAFENAVLQAGAEVKRERTFYDRRGAAVFRLIELVPPAKDSLK